MGTRTRKPKMEMEALRKEKDPAKPAGIDGTRMNISPSEKIQPIKAKDTFMRSSSFDIFPLPCNLPNL